MQRLEEGRYRLGSRVYYLRQFKNHVMVRVGGGWLTLDSFLERHDPCRRGHRTRPADGCHSTSVPAFNEAKLNLNAAATLQRQQSNDSSTGGSTSTRSSARSVKRERHTLGRSGGGGGGGQLSFDKQRNQSDTDIRRPSRPSITTPRGPNLRTASRSRERTARSERAVQQTVRH